MFDLNKIFAFFGFGKSAELTVDQIVGAVSDEVSSHRGEVAYENQRFIDAQAAIEAAHARRVGEEENRHVGVVGHLYARLAEVAASIKATIAKANADLEAVEAAEQMLRGDASAA